MSNLCLTCNHVLLYEDVILDKNGAVTCAECVKNAKLAKKSKWDLELPVKVIVLKDLLDDLSTTNVLDSVVMVAKMRAIQDEVLSLSYVVQA